MKLVGVLVLAASALAVAWLGYRLVVLQPSNQREWEYGMDAPPHVTMSGDLVSVQGIRDFDWMDGAPHPSGYVDRTFNVQRLERVWFVSEPFTLAPIYGVEAVAHTYFVFDFEDQPPVAISVESRRERGEGYDPLHGLINEYELIYLWGTERDLTGRRALVEKNELFMYPLVGSMDAARRLFVNLASATQQLETQPRFYNTLTSNCTNELAKAANQAQPGAIPPNIALLLPGYADDLLYDLGFIPNDAPLESVRQRFAITDDVAATINQPEFSRLLRTRLIAP